jgi:hypothetical protein
MKVYSGWLGMVGPSARHDPLNGDQVVPGLRLRPDRPARHDPFLFIAVSSCASKDTSPVRLRPSRPSMAHWPGIPTPPLFSKMIQLPLS